TKVTYVLLWFFKREFKGREDWYISTYHWGGFLSKRWDNGLGEVPLTFTLNGIEYNVIKYYLTFKGLQEAYESGQLEVGKRIDEKWKQYHEKMVEEEIDFRMTKKIVRDLRTQLAEKRKLESELEKKDQEILLALNDASKQLKEIAKDSQKDGTVSLRKVKNVVKDLLKNIKK
ncbi:MAG: hypothetical protein KKH98_02170, partial [Spirochaetes bacterium]|nr:hypothetical protein [Spirochaetota bacterium]